MLEEVHALQDDSAVRRTVSFLEIEPFHSSSPYFIRYAKSYHADHHKTIGQVRNPIYGLRRSTRYIYRSANPHITVIYEMRQTLHCPYTLIDVSTSHLFDCSITPMTFPDRLATFRKQRGFTQKQLADRAKVHMVQINRYEAGLTCPNLDVMKRLAIALCVSTDSLLFDSSELRLDEDFRPIFEGLRALGPDDKLVAKSVLEALLLKHRMSVGGPVAPAVGKIVSL
ncbi:helix-turn-helix transcriptional regulator [Burkholderia sp. BCC0405]|uniref:helix-turn-helix domain-containing protein n=1 Tax=Burkholderia sp. BCC0405 TaxID=2676298 RepID=UPI001FC7BE2F|nr:helix-turn-helix transcriptional regulator [Burkholderia sp. BCC0405]